VATSRPEFEEAPSPLEHATPDAELADAQLAVGRPEPADAPGVEAEPESPAADEEPLVDGEEELSALDREAANAGDFDDEGSADAGGGSGGGGLARMDTSGAVPEPRRVPGNRLINFLQGSWHELQRVQWPDRRQVMQATGVVIGFVIVAGVYLGVADAVASKLMDLILK
jgi:preprotein translocase SecE subunit